MVNNTMDALEWLRKQLDGDENDLLREMVLEFAQRLIGFVNRFWPHRAHLIEYSGVFVHPG